jgi:hypothetical protein
VRGQSHQFSNFWDAESNEDIDTKDIDHISFHSDGTIHISYTTSKSKKAHFFERKLNYPISKLPDNSYIPLFTLSINIPQTFASYLGSDTAPEIGEHIADLQWDIHSKPFSFTLFAIRNNEDPISIIANRFPNLFEIPDSPLFPYAINKNIGLMFMFSKRLVLARNQEYVNPRHMSNEDMKFEDLPVMGISIVPSDKRLLRLENI